MAPPQINSQGVINPVLTLVGKVGMAGTPLHINLLDRKVGKIRRSRRPWVFGHLTEFGAVLPRQGLGALTAGLDALDLVAVHDQLVLLADLHVVLEATVHRVIPGQV